MIKLNYLCLGLIYSVLAVSAQRPSGTFVKSDIGQSITTITSAQVPPATETEIQALSGPYSVAAIGNGPLLNSGNPNISLLGNDINSSDPSTLTTSANSTSPFKLALLQLLESKQHAGSYPTENYTLFLVDIHFYAGNLSSQYIAYHYCHFVSADFMQCALYNSRSADARFIGIEYFITKAIFDTLPNWERNLWHSHPFEIQSGLFVAPDLSTTEELEVLQWLMGTFGKVTDTWRFYEDFPIGPAQVGLALGLASQVNWTVVAEMDNILNLSTTYQQRQQQRAQLVTPPRTQGADNYIFSGYATNYEIYSFPLENNGTVLGAANATGSSISNATASVSGNVTIPQPSNPAALPAPSPEATFGSNDSLPNPLAPTVI